MKSVIIIGGGAAGFFTANCIKEEYPDCKITIVEKTQKILSKVKVSGGGRCNVTNEVWQPGKLIKNYPRGEKKLKGPFHVFNPQDTQEWFQKRGVELKIEPDGRVFPVSNSSQDVIDCLERVLDQSDVQLITGEKIIGFYEEDGSWRLDTDDHEYIADKMVLAAGSDKHFLQLVTELTKHTVVSQVPSLFTFKIEDSRIHGLMGLAISDAQVKIQGTKLVESGPVLITHWGLSGPAILRLSAWGARVLEEKKYDFKIQINFCNKPFDEVRDELNLMKDESPKKHLYKHNMFDLPKRLWMSLCNYCEITEEQTCQEINKKQLNKLANELTQGEYSVNGKTTFKEEFVTAGGIALGEIDFETMQSRLHPGLYFAGEILDIDAITGGFNFQACWTAGYIISKNLLNINNPKK